MLYGRQLHTLHEVQITLNALRVPDLQPAGNSRVSSKMTVAMTKDVTCKKTSRLLMKRRVTLETKSLEMVHDQGETKSAPRTLSLSQITLGKGANQRLNF
jgi:hypothetical protein